MPADHHPTHHVFEFVPIVGTEPEWPLQAGGSDVRIERARGRCATAARELLAERADVDHVVIYYTGPRPAELRKRLATVGRIGGWQPDLQPERSV